MIAVLAAFTCILSGCNRNAGTEAGSDSDTAAPSETPRIETADLSPETTVPPVTETEPTEVQMTTESDTQIETEEVTTEVLLETETDAPESAVMEAETEEDTAAETELPTPVIPDASDPVIPEPAVKSVIDLTGQAVCGGEAVTGQFVSAQSEHIRLIIDYALEWQEDNDYLLTLDVGLSYYELWCSERSAGGIITVDGVSRTFASPAIAHDAHEKAYTPFFTQTYNCNGNALASVDVSWAFNGTYGGVQIGTLSAGAILQWGDDASDPSEQTPPQPVETEVTVSGTELPPVTEAVTQPATDVQTPETVSPETEAASETEPAAETAEEPLPETDAVIDTDTLQETAPDPVTEAAQEPEAALPA